MFKRTFWEVIATLTEGAVYSIRPSVVIQSPNNKWVYQRMQKMNNTTEDRIKVLQVQIAVEKNYDKKMKMQKKLEELKLMKRAQELRNQNK
jgi:hypothetical protein